MDDLIWSVRPKHTLEERKRLVAMQPALLTNLRAGMERLSIPPTERDDFLAKLVRAHGRTAVNRDDLDDEQDEAAEIADTAGSTKSAPAVQRERKAPAPVQARREVSVPAPLEDECSRKVQQLQTGTWLEILDDNGTAARAKLSWISPITGTYLFTDRQGLKAGNYTREELAHLMRRARARVLNSTPLMDRAVGTVLKQYQKQ
jgi:hypothetical protein